MKVETLDLGYLAIPDELPTGGAPALVVIHDVWGLYEHYRDLARRFAGWGFVTLSVDLYRPLGGATVTEFASFMRELSDPLVLETVQAAVDYVAARPEVAGRKVGLTGFCMGGMYTLLAAASVNGIAAAAPFYGLLSHEHGPLFSESGLDPVKKPRQPIDAARDVKCPILAFYGTDDTLIPLEDAQALRERLKAVPVPAEVLIYDGAGHAFVNDTREQLYRPEQARDALARLRAFMTSHLAESPA